MNMSGHVGWSELELADMSSPERARDEVTLCQSETRRKCETLPL